MPPGVEQHRIWRHVAVDDPGAVEGLESSERVVKDHECGSRGKGPGHVDEVTERDRVHPFVHDRGVPVVEVDDREQVLMAERAEHTHVVADLAAVRGVGGQRGAQEPDDHLRAGGRVVGVDERAGSIDADPPIQRVARDVCPRPGNVVAASLVHASPSMPSQKRRGVDLRTGGTTLGP